MKIEVVCSPETSMSTSKFTQSYKPEDQHGQLTAERNSNFIAKDEVVSHLCAVTLKHGL
jgi:hypothetical protein